MRNIRQLLVALMITSLAACGGGGTLGSGGGDSGGGTGGSAPVFTLALTITNTAGTETNNLSQDTPLVVTATLTATNDGNVANQLINFEVSGEGLAALGNDAGAASTNAEGVATIPLLVGNRSGAGQINASFGEVSASAVFNSAGDGGDQVDITIGSVRLIADKLLLGSGATDKVELSALVRDVNNVTLSEVPVTFSADSGEINIVDTVTGPNGIAKATLTTLSDSNNREISIVARVQQQTAELIIDVVGTNLEIAAPSAVVLNDSATIDVFVTDSSGNGIQGVVLDVSSALGNTLNETNPETVGSGGKASFTYTGVNSGVDTLTVSALGISSNVELNVSPDTFVFEQVNGEEDGVVEIPLNTAQGLGVQWLIDESPNAGEAISFATSRGFIATSAAGLVDEHVTVSQNTDADGEAQVFVQSGFAGLATIAAQGGDAGSSVNAQKIVEFVATTPTKVEVQAFPAQVGLGETSAVRAIVRDASNNPVKNQNVVFTLDNSAGGQLSAVLARTNSQGVASTVFSADSTTGGGVEGLNLVVKGALAANDAIVGQTDIAVGRRTLFFRFGTGNVITKPNDSTYSKEFSVIVTDSSGNPVPNQQLNVAVVPVSYSKGIWVKSPPAPATFKNWAAQVSATCLNEDVNLDGILEISEDTNGDGQITPGNRATVPVTVTADESGIAVFNVQYPQDVGAWMDVRLQVSGTASGTENVSSREYGLPVSSEDVTVETSPPPSNPFGVVGDCTVVD
ncbi:Ig-like domain (group 1) [Arsukibacterium tuosuense]|uniref:Ig-like domain (Group 1) n=1 Tax=Arsukibacterium tuosuense TaxID=1323745 RepID=A0A285J8Y0_9GAMM|nr:Ig-like domain-containing protein [Arsukibacterium tuosuense]SNY55806.1 Ig-like domain (group 1) [Arsukibacterium tuosuense]